jgi:hypothetical protein
VVDPETFVTELYVAIDTICKAHPAAPRPGPAAALVPSEVVTLALFGQWGQFRSEAAFYRYAGKHLRGCFPTLPSRPQLNRVIRRTQATIVAVALELGTNAAAPGCPYEVIDGTGLPTRNAKRRGRGWLAGDADIGKCTRLGWYEGVRLLTGVTPDGAITGWGIGPASTNDRTLAETFFAGRAQPHPGLASVGRPVSDQYVADTGFAGVRWERHWATAYGAVVVCPPHPHSRRRWPKPRRTWLAGLRQITEAVNDRLLFTFRLDRERPHDLGGLQARLAATVALHNFCLLLNRLHGRPDLAFADLVDW